MTKSEIRRNYKARRNELTSELMIEYNKRILERLFALDQFMRCTMLFTYISFGNEVDTHEIINKALQMNKKVYVPRVENKECQASQENLMLNEINFYEIQGIDNLIRSNYGILEPDSDTRDKYVSSMSDNNKLMLLPGLVFDTKGNRIGYGAGYYDRYLGKFAGDEWNKVALAYDFQIANKLTVGIYDVPVDFIVTPDRIIICKE